jgi:hypothetical protein
MKPDYTTQTYRASKRIMSAIRLADEYKTDPERSTRYLKQECIACYYVTRICGQGFTKYTCLECMKEDMHANTCVPVLCLECSRKMDRCQHCGAEMSVMERSTG